MSRGVAVGPVSRADQDTVVGVPGSSVASIVVRPAEALDCFLRTRMDVIVLGQQVITKAAA